MARLDKIKYKPISVRDLITEMKDLSELMIDLAYSAALFNSRPLAEEVIEMERRVDNLAYLLDMSAMVAARDPRDAESLVAVSMVASAADKISDAAGDIAGIVLREIGIHPIVRAAFEQVEERLTRVEIEKGSVWANKTLKDLELAPKMGVDIIAIRRNKDFIINPEKDELILEGDVVIARGAPMGVEEFERLAGRTLQAARS
ncbi:MAG TPA: TrkA C-terminal domain-containing protein [Candidatus Bathyarchaeia archaeon]|nr:TrkA C-terminal domain-containing protein [Candidatus Bathyarchaeia archaeon]